MRQRREKYIVVQEVVKKVKRKNPKIILAIVTETY